VLGDHGGADRVFVIRHDVDQQPRSALEMASIEAEVGVTSTWYFRWRTAAPVAIEELKSAGAEVGLHYETLTRFALHFGLSEPITEGPILGECRLLLREEISAFERRFGRARSASAHGDSRVPAVHNSLLLDGEDPSAYGLEFDGSFALRRKRVAAWVTDRASSRTWADGADPVSLLVEGVSPILCLTHPNNWASGISLWADRVAAAALPAPGGEGRARALRTGDDAPPL